MPRNRPAQPRIAGKKPKEIVLFVRMTPAHEKALNSLVARSAEKGKPHSRQAVVLALIERAAS
jgi:hypothetical protein